MQFVPYTASRDVPNIVVDGSPNEGTVLTLTHWPGIARPPGLVHDLSAGMAFRYLEAPPEHPPVEAVTNNHFDQDGLVSAFVLAEPSTASEYRELLLDLAAAGDFGTYRDRRAARASMVVSRLAEQPYDDYDAFCGERYLEALPMVVPMLLDNDRFRELWADEDEQLTRSEQALATGTVTIEDDPELDLAIVRADARWRPARGHRFGGRAYEGVHPMALNNATPRVRLLLIHGRRYRYTDRYETWVQFVSRPVPARRDLRPLAEQLTALETGGATWQAEPPGALTPTLDHTGESSLEPDAVVAAIRRHFRTAPPAWDPSAT